MAYHAALFPEVSRVYRLNKDTLLGKLEPYGITQLNFVNIYDSPDG